MARGSFTYGSVTMKTQDVRLFSGSYWLNDQCLSFYIEYLSRKYRLPRVLLLEPAASFLIGMENDPEDLRIGLNRLDLDTPELLFLPINDNTDPETSGGSHWTLLVLSKSTWTGYHFNSLGAGGCNLSQARLVACRLGSLLCAPRALPIQEVTVTPPQANSYDCGLYVLSITETLLHDLQTDPSLPESSLLPRHFTRLSPQDITEKRRSMFTLVSEVTGL